MNVKKLSISIALAVTAGLAASSASAYVVAVPSHGVLVPMAMHTGSGNTTAVGLINHSATQSVTVYWSFFDTNSEKLIDGDFPMTPKDFVGVDLAFVAPNFVGVRGYWTFAVGDSQGNPIGAKISASAFQANAIDGDAEFIPTFPISVGDWAPDTDLFSIEPTDLATLQSGAFGGSTIDLRYADDGDLSSQIVLWSTGSLNQNFRVQIYNDDQDRISGRMECPNREVCAFDVNSANLPAKPAGFTNGFIDWKVPAGESAVSFTRVSSGTFGAVQTILNTHYPAGPDVTPPAGWVPDYSFWSDNAQ